MPKPRKPTPNQLEWQKEVARLQRAAKRAEKQGKPVPVNFIPPTPKRITKKQLNLIKSITLKPERPQKEIERKLAKPKRGSETRRTRVVEGEETPVRKGRKPARRKSEESKERERIRSTINRAKKRGYEVPTMDDVVAAKPSGIALLDYLRSLRGDNLYRMFRYGVYKDAEGNTVYQSGVERRAEENSARVQLGVAHRKEALDPIFEPYIETGEKEVLDALQQYIAHVRQQLDEFTPNDYWSTSFASKKTEHRDELRELVEGAIEGDGELTVATRISGADTFFYRHIDVILYSSDDGDVEFSMAQVATVILGRPLTAEESERLTEDN